MSCPAPGPLECCAGMPAAMTVDYEVTVTGSHMMSADSNKP